MDSLDEQIKIREDELKRITALSEKKKKLKMLDDKIAATKPINQLINNLIKKFK